MTSVTRDVVNIPFESLSPLSRSLFRLDVMTYQLRLLFMRGESSYEDVTKAIDAEFTNNIITIRGPLYDETRIDSPDTPQLIRNWKIIFDNYLFTKGFIDSLVQLRVVSVNPVTIYYKLLLEEDKINASQGQSTPNLMMRRIALKRKPTKRPIPIKDLKIPDEQLVYDRTRREEKFEYQTTTFMDGHVFIDRENKYPPAEGFVDESIPETTLVNAEVDRLNGIIVNLFPGYPFYAFNYRNLYPKINDINRLIESGMQIVFVTPIDNQPIKKVEYEYIRFFNDWGIPIIDYVNNERLVSAELDTLVPSAESVDGVKYVNIPNFFVIQRPMEKFHNADWCGINTERSRGLAGIPWAKSLYSGNDLANPQPDDGFLEYFVKEGVRRRLAGKLTLQVFFPLCTIHTNSEVKRLLTKIEKVLGRSIKNYNYGKEGVMGVFLRSMGEWILVRAVLRKYL